MWVKFRNGQGASYTTETKTEHNKTLHFIGDTLNTLRPRQNGRHFPDDIFKCIFLNENAWILIKISLKFVPKGPINKIPTLVQIMAWRRSGDKPLSEPMMVSLLTHICVTRPQWVNTNIRTLCVMPENAEGTLSIPSFQPHTSGNERCYICIVISHWLRKYTCGLSHDIAYVYGR